MIRRLLVDYGEVLSAPLAEDAIVLFIDDRAENTRAAGDLGMRTITFTSASDLDRELRLATAEIPIAEARKQRGYSE
jgi:hypothetical protein